MGYSTYIGILPKKEYNKIKSMTKGQLIEFKKMELDEDELEEGYLGIGVYDFGKTLYNFGKYTDFNPPKNCTLTFFKNKELNNYFTEEHDFCVVKPEFLEYLIEYYSQMIKKYYNEMLTPFYESTDQYDRNKNKPFLESAKTKYAYPQDSHTFDFTKITDDEQTALFKIIQHIQQMSSEWYGERRPYKLKQNSDCLISSSKYEYAVFELVKIYNTFDWKRNIMYFYGY